ncbi:MAG: sulfite exporter TauE/SafE family protein [Myxococcales bacterium]
MSAYDAAMLVVLVFAGIAAGWINTVAGGGSMLTVPALMWCGLPVDLANGTSRIAILAQGVTAVAGFRRHNTLDDTRLLTEIAVPNVVGAVIGAFVATLIPNAVFKPILIGALLLMAFSLFLKPESFLPPEGSVPLRPSQRPSAVLALLFSGFYGGFLQAGVGFVLLAVFAGMLRIDLVRGNGLKVAVVFVYSVVVVLVFAARSRVDYAYGALLALGQVVGAEAGVRFSVKRGQGAIKKVVFVMIIVSGVSLFFR